MERKAKDRWLKSKGCRSGVENRGVLRKKFLALCDGGGGERGILADLFQLYFQRKGNGEMGGEMRGARGPKIAEAIS